MRSLAVTTMWAGAFVWVSLGAADGVYPVNPQVRQTVPLPDFLKGKSFYITAVTGGGDESSVRTARTWTSPNPVGLPPGVNFNRDLKMENLFWQRDPRDVVREAVLQSLSQGGRLADSEANADYSLALTIFRYGLAEATWREYYAKLEVLGQIKNMRTGAAASVVALGTSVAKLEDRKNKSAEAVQSGLEIALGRGVANLLNSREFKSCLGAGDSGAANRAAIELRRFSVSDGMTLPSEFPDFLYAVLVEKLAEARLPLAVLGENELAGSMTLDGRMLAVRGAWYRGAGEKKLTAEVSLRRNGGEVLFRKEISAAPSVWKRVSYEDENELWSAAALADRIVKEIQAALKRAGPDS